MLCQDLVELELPEPVDAIKSVTPEDGRAFARTVCLVRHLDPLPEALRDPFIDEVLDRVGDPLVLDHVRLNMTARGG